MIITAKDKIPIEKDFKVEAGPGAGKTEFLVNHIKNVLQITTRLSCVRKVACITYTNTAVETILKRLGKGVADKVEVSTIHSFLYKNVVKPYCSFIPNEYELDCKKINGHDEFFVNSKYVREWLDNKEFDKLDNPNTRNQILKLLALNQALKSWLLSIKCVYKSNTISFQCDNTKAVGYDNKKNIRNGIKAKNLKILSSKLIELKKIYWRKGKLEHNDILFFSYILIEKYPFILDVLRAKYPYIFIDEYQDTNPVQAYIVSEIRKKETIVGVIGDKAQSIYSFQGADSSLFDSFKVDKNSKYTIIENHRSSNQIVKFLNNVRNDINQDPCEDIDGDEAIIFVGDRNTAYNEACKICKKDKEKTVVSLSRDNINSNAMKKEIEGNDLNKKLLEEYSNMDSSSERKNYILSFIEAIELAINCKYKESIKRIEWIFRNEADPKKIALYSLSKMLKEYYSYNEGTLMQFYNVICLTINANLSGFRKGRAKDFYEQNSYKSMAICINIVDDTSNHITIHKAKGSEYKNVMIIGTKNTKDMLLNPKLDANEEHRINYVGMSRAEKRLFIQIDDLTADEEKELQKKYEGIFVERL